MFRKKVKLMEAPPGGEPVYIKKPRKASKKKKEPKQYKHPMMRSLHGQNLMVRFKMVGEDKFDTTEYWTTMNEETLIGLGYTPAIDYKTDFRDIFTHVYAKFEGFEMHPCVRVDADGNAYEVHSLETASTLYDHFMSNAELEFMEGMKVKGISTLSGKQLIFYIIIAVGVIIGGWMITHGGV